MLNKILFLLISFKKDTVKYLLSLIKKINIKFPKINSQSHLSKTKNHQTDPILCEVQEFLLLLQKECHLYLPETPRFTDIKNEIKATGTYWQTYDELAYGAKLAWRNSTRCIGRNYWDLLSVNDYRSLNKPDEIFDALAIL